MRIIAFVLDQAPAITDWPELDQTAGRGGGRGEWAVNVPSMGQAVKTHLSVALAVPGLAASVRC